MKKIFIILIIFLSINCFGQSYPNIDDYATVVSSEEIERFKLNPAWSINADTLWSEYRSLYGIENSHLERPYGGHKLGEVKKIYEETCKLFRQFALETDPKLLKDLDTADVPIDEIGDYIGNYYRNLRKFEILFLEELRKRDQPTIN